LKAIDIQAQCPVEFSELAVGQFASKAIIANNLPNNLPIFPLHIALVVASSGTPFGEGDVFLFTKREQFHIDKLGTVVRVDPYEWKREQLLCPLEGSNDSFLTTTQEWKALGPPWAIFVRVNV